MWGVLQCLSSHQTALPFWTSPAGSTTSVTLLLEADTHDGLSSRVDPYVFLVRWGFDGEDGSNFADLAARGCSSATSSFFVIRDDPGQDLLVGRIKQASFTLPSILPLPAAGWLMLAGLGALGLARRHRRA